jgi:hypothetical protein
MLGIAHEDIANRIARDNPWWSNDATQPLEAAYQRRIYFEPFSEMALNFGVRRATILLGPRRVGKTVMARQLVAAAIQKGLNPKAILYASIDAPIFAGMALEKFLTFFSKDTQGQKLVLFDEIQYLKDWERHLKDLVDNYPDVKFVATGSAAAALKLKSNESGAGRFSEFILPPLTFHEFLVFSGEDANLIGSELDENNRNLYQARDIEELNSRFVEYLNFGGYPEVVLNPEIKRNPDQFIRNDIIDKVLLKDLPNLYGISNIQELNKLFSFLAYNSGREASLENISQESGLTKPTIKKYIEYLESAFLIIKLSTIDENSRSMKRERQFKIFLTNPSMRAALFSPVEFTDSRQIGHLAEAAILAQWQHSPNFRNLRYARWKNQGEVDVVYLPSSIEKPKWIGEIKWSDRIRDKQHVELKNIGVFLLHNESVEEVFFTTRTYKAERDFMGIKLRIIPSALYCYTVGRNITSRRVGSE